MTPLARSLCLGLYLVIGGAAGCAAGCKGCTSPSPEPKADPEGPEGPEEPAALEGVRGHLLLTRGPQLVDVELPGGKETVLREREGSPARNVAGPDAKGRVAFTVDVDRRSHALKVIELGGHGERDLFVRPGQAGWDGASGKKLAMSRDGKVAVIEAMKGEQTGDALIEVGGLEIWNVDTNAGGPVGVRAADAGLSFFPDGTKLAYVALEATSEAAAHPSGPEAIGDWSRRKKVYVVHVLDLATKADVALGVGKAPAVSADGSSVLVMDGREKLRKIDVATRASTAIDAPGAMASGPVAMLDGQTILYRARTTRGALQKQRGTSMGGRELLHTVKVVRLDGPRAFATVTDGLSFHDEVSFGAITAPR